MLAVTLATIDFYGAVSTECAEEMAKGALAHASVDLAISVTGIAGPTGALVGKPLGSSIFVLHRAAAASSRTIGNMAISAGPTCACASVLQAFSMLQELAEEEPHPQKSKDNKPVIQALSQHTSRKDCPVGRRREGGL